MQYTVSLYRKDRFKEIETLVRRPFKEFDEVSDSLKYHLEQKIVSLPNTSPNDELLSRLVEELISQDTVSHPGLHPNFGITNVLLVVDGELRHFTVSFSDHSEIKGSLSFIPSFA